MKPAGEENGPHKVLTRLRYTILVATRRRYAQFAYMATLTDPRPPAPAKETTAPERPRRPRLRHPGRELLLAQAAHAEKAMGPEYGFNITGMSSAEFKARMRRLMGRG